MVRRNNRNRRRNNDAACNWSDEIFLNNFARLGACSGKPNLLTGTVSAKALLNWYMGGDKPNNPTDNILTILYCMKLSAVHLPRDINSVFSTKLMKDGPKLQPADTAEKIDLTSYKSKLIKIPASKKEKLPDGSFTKEVAIEWYNEIWAMLDSENLLQKQTAVNLVGFLYMILMRLSVKQVSNVTRYIYQKGDYNFRSLWMQESSMFLKSTRFCPPHEAMALTFKKEFARFQPNCTKIISTIIYSYYEGEQGPHQRIINRILNASFLSSLEHVGLGLFSWIGRAAAALSISVKDLIGHIESKTGNRHKPTIRSFMNLTQRLSGQITWRWARLLDDKALTDLNKSKDPLFILTMVAIVHLSDHDPDVWNIPSLKKEDIETHKEEAVSTARRIQEAIKVDFEHTIQQMMTKLRV